MFANCSEAVEAGAAPLYVGDPGYSEELDSNGDGIACPLEDEAAGAGAVVAADAGAGAAAGGAMGSMGNPAPAPAPAPAAGGGYYANCSAARAAGVAPIPAGAPGYRAGLDRDNDGWACE